MTGKYTPLEDYLRALPKNKKAERLSFEQIESILKFKLPSFAYEDSAGGCMRKKPITSTRARGQTLAGSSSALRSTRNRPDWFVLNKIQKLHNARKRQGTVGANIMRSTNLIFLCLALAVSACATPTTPPPTPTPIVIYSQTSFAGTTEVTPGLYDQLGLLAPEANSPRRDLYQIFTNNSSQDVQVYKATLFGNVYVPSTAVLVPVILGAANGIPNLGIPDTEPSHVLATASVPVSAEEPGPIEISFSPAVTMLAGEQLAFGFIVPLTDTVDATLLGTDTVLYEISSTVPPYFTGFYVTDAQGTWGLAIGSHYLVIESVVE